MSYLDWYYFVLSCHFTYLALPCLVLSCLVDRFSFLRARPQFDFFCSEEEISAHNPPHSAVPRLHCLVAKVLKDEAEVALAVRNISTDLPIQRLNPFNVKDFSGMPVIS